MGLLLIAFFADFLANEKPIYCQIDGEVMFPVFRDYAVEMGWSSWEAKFVQNDWSDHDYDFKIMPLIPYSPTSTDRKNTRFKSPFDEQNVPSLRYRHWLGTDNLGRDVTAGMIHGTRVAMMVGIGSMLLAGIIGLLLGSLAGYFGDEKMKVSWVTLCLLIIGGVLGIFYGFIARSFAISEGVVGWELLKGFLICLVVIGLFFLMGKGLSRLSFFNKKITLPIDAIVMRLIEIFNSIPGLFLLLAILSILRSQSIFNIILIIGIIGWTNIARFVRAEFLRIRNLEYIYAAETMGFSTWRIIKNHALPNAIRPVLITLAFGMAGAILAEATISFLGIGVPFNSFTWGKMLSIARQNFSAWWLVVFPGIGIFVTVTVFNLIGDGVSSGD